ncbi:hypothetical protein HHK36_022574 [Tetracentron sinense]|uniref:Uncharacterized protein n=1 Tax=Tetracentron sinense TaxID=13715 RepID=A0A834YPT7_TETSI|nr:hypothetical protein HHK36_022574 [Tetracentron sinense]
MGVTDHQRTPIPNLGLTCFLMCLYSSSTNSDPQSTCRLLVFVFNLWLIVNLTPIPLLKFQKLQPDLTLVTKLTLLAQDF